MFSIWFMYNVITNNVYMLLQGSILILNGKLADCGYSSSLPVSAMDKNIFYFFHGVIYIKSIVSVSIEYSQFSHSHLWQKVWNIILAILCYKNMSQKIYT